MYSYRMVCIKSTVLMFFDMHIPSMNYNVPARADTMGYIGHELLSFQ